MNSELYPLQKQVHLHLPVGCLTFLNARGPLLPSFHNHQKQHCKPYNKLLGTSHIALLYLRMSHHPKMPYGADIHHGQ